MAYQADLREYIIQTVRQWLKMALDLEDRQVIVAYSKIPKQQKPFLLVSLTSFDNPIGQDEDKYLVNQDNFLTHSTKGVRSALVAINGFGEGSAQWLSIAATSIRREKIQRFLRERKLNVNSFGALVDMTQLVNEEYEVRFLREFSLTYGMISEPEDVIAARRLTIDVETDGDNSNILVEHEWTDFYHWFNRTFKPKFFWTGEFNSKLGLWTGAKSAKIVGDVGFSPTNKLPASKFRKSGYLEFEDLASPLDFIHREGEMEWAIGLFLRADSFSGTSDLLNIGDLNVDPVSFYLYVSDGGQLDLDFYCDSDEFTSQPFASSPGETTPTIEVDKDIFLLMTSDGITLDFYVQSDLKLSANRRDSGSSHYPSLDYKGTDGTLNWTGGIRLGGASMGELDFAFDGDIYSTFILDRALGEEEISDIFEKAKKAGLVSRT